MGYRRRQPRKKWAILKSYNELGKKRIGYVTLMTLRSFPNSL